MAEKKYLDDVGLDEVAQHVNRRLKVVDVMPVSANNGAVRLYSGADDDPFLQGHIYKYENNAWVDITGTAEATEVIVNVETLPTGEDIEDVFYRVTSTGKLYKGDSTNQTTSLVTPDFDSNDFEVDNNNVALSAAQRIFTGTTAEWEALTTEEKANYTVVNFSDDDNPEEFDTRLSAVENVIPSGASASNKLAARSDIYILSNQYSGATYTTVNALLEKVAADMLAKGGYGGAVGSVWTGKSYFSGTYGTNGSTAGNARLHFENAQGGYTECSFNFSSSGLGTVNWFNDVTTSTVTSGSAAPITSGGVYNALNNKTSITVTSADSVYIDNDIIYYYPQTKRMLFNRCAFVYTRGSTMPAGKTLCTITIPDGITISEKGIMIPAMLSVPTTGEELPSAVMLNPDGTIVTTNSETNYQYVIIYGVNVFFE